MKFIGKTVLIKYPPPNELIEKFARGLTTMLHPHFQHFKCQLFDSHNYFRPQYEFNDTAIVFQGPIAYDNNYTVDTFKLYRAIYPNVPIVISTWRGEATENFRRECRDNSIILLENEMPQEHAPFNVNLQLVSSFQGVKYIRENTAAKFVLKTRTDQRINHFGFLVYFKNLLETFPPRGNKLNERIIFVNSTTSKSWPFFFNDYLAFGHVEDIYKLYDIPPYKEPGKMQYMVKNGKRHMRLKQMLFSNPIDYKLITEPNHKLKKFNKMMSRWWFAEVYIARNFHEKYIAPIDETKLLETSLKFTADYLILVGGNEIFLDWAKYETLRYKAMFDFEEPNIFSYWLELYRNFKIDWV